MIRPGERALVDSQSHASVMLATQVLQANGVPISTVPHSDMVALTEAIEEAPDSERVWYLTDGVFSMKGDVAPAEELLALLDEHPNLHIYCDDAHGFGWDGLHGRGQQLRRMGWHERLVVVVGLAKAFGSLGGVIAVPSGELAETIELTGPVLTFGGPIPPPNLGASVASADILLSEELPDRQSQLLTRIRQVNDLGAQMGLPLAAWDETPLWFLDVGELSDMMKLVVGMRDSGFFLNAAAFPVVPQGHAGVRFTVTLDNSPSQIEAMLSQLNDKRLELFGETEIEIDLTGQAAESEVAAEQQTDAAN
jgi:7-keto-8-aminopelargonate synthetase-like enzyme